MSAFRSVLLAAVITASFSGAAFARDAVFTAKIGTPVSTQTRVIADNAIWNCSGDTCSARPTHAVSVTACRQLARQAGSRITAYGSEERQLTDQEIASCNGDAAAIQQARN
jgi:hypothetical protein